MSVIGSVRPKDREPNNVNKIAPEKNAENSESSDADLIADLGPPIAAAIPNWDNGINSNTKKHARRNSPRAEDQSVVYQNLKDY